MNKSKTKTWICLIITLVFLIIIYFILDKLNKEGMKLEKTCVNSSGTKICVPKTKNCLSTPDGSYDCT